MTTNEAVTRAGTAIDIWSKDRLDFVLSSADRDELARAVLNAAGAGEAVDREVRRCEHDPGCIVAHSVNCREKNGVDREHVDDYLAARGDAATPTEVEWGVRYGIGPGVDAKYSEEDARNTAQRYAHFDAVAVQRTVSAWREVS